MKIPRLLAVASAAFFVVSAHAQNVGTVTNHAFALGKGAGQQGFTSLLCASTQLAIGQSAANPSCFALSGDITMDASGVTTIGSAKVTIAKGGTGQSTQQAGFDALAPTATRAGDLVYWNGTHYVTLAGNNSGTQFLQENASGVPSWVTVAGTGTVTTLTAGYGLTFSSGATCTSSCTISASLSELTNSISGDVTLNNTTSYFAGPTVAQGTTGTWFCSGTATVTDTAGAAAFDVRLTDGTTTFASTRGLTNGASVAASISVSGILASPAASIVLQVKDVTSTSGKILFNVTSQSKDSTLSCVRVI